MSLSKVSTYRAFQDTFYHEMFGGRREEVLGFYRLAHEIVESGESAEDFFEVVRASCILTKDTLQVIVAASYFSRFHRDIRLLELAKMLWVDRLISFLKKKKVLENGRVTGYYPVADHTTLKLNNNE